MLASKWINAGLMVAIATPIAAALAATDGPIGEDGDIAARRAPLYAETTLPDAPLPETEGFSETMAGGLTVATGIQYAENKAEMMYSAGPVPWSMEWYHVCEASYTSFGPEVEVSVRGSS